MNLTDFEDRHPATLHLLQYFNYQHLPPYLAAISRIAAETAEGMVRNLPDGPELTAGLRKLLEAKDCFVRAALEVAQGGEKL